MQDYTAADFMGTLNEPERRTAEAVRSHIESNYPEYKPFDIRPSSKTLNEWTLNFRKKPKTGKALCTLYSTGGKLSIRIVPLGFMDLELLLRQNEFDENLRKFILRDICKGCRSECGFDYEYRKYFYAQGRLYVTAKPNCASREYVTEYAEISGISTDGVDGVLRLIDIQSRHMTQDPRDIRGSGYLETSRNRCGNIEVVTLGQTELDTDNFVQSDYADIKKLDKYAAVYHLTPMGAAHGGLWYFHDDKAVCGAASGGYCNATIPEGRYACVTVTDPFAFSPWRVWSYIAKWIYESGLHIRTVVFDGACVPYFVKIFRQGGNQYMSAFVPVE